MYFTAHRARKSGQIRLQAGADTFDLTDWQAGILASTLLHAIAGHWDAEPVGGSPLSCCDEVGSDVSLTVGRCDVELDHCQALSLADAIVDAATTEPDIDDGEDDDAAYRRAVDRELLDWDEP
ncbi:MAG: hypothetical protein Q3979_05475 [Actinomycetaceae bacterium]|nr:hypothetical protein [Actinomycetaceae bacterium]